MPKSYNISLIGAGNLGWSLAKSLEDAGHTIKEVFSQTIENAEELCMELYDAVPTQDPSFENSNSQIFLIAIKDDALREDLDQFSFPGNAIVAHCSGVTGVEVLQGLSENSGVLYPLQSFTKGKKTDMKNVPILIEGNDYDAYEAMESIGRSLSKSVFKTTGEQRRMIHLSAVFASNFTNYLLHIAKEKLGSTGVNIDILKPLVVWTIEKAFSIGPENSQTGPAFRKDFDTIDQHLEILKEEPHLVELYENFSRQIMDLGDELQSRDLTN